MIRIISSFSCHGLYNRLLQLSIEFSSDRMEINEILGLVIRIDGEDVGEIFAENFQIVHTNLEMRNKL